MYEELLSEKKKLDSWNFKWSNVSRRFAGFTMSAAVMKKKEKDKSGNKRISLDTKCEKIKQEGKLNYDNQTNYQKIWMANEM